MSEKETILMATDEIIQVFEIFKANDPNPVTELASVNPFTLLVSVALSAQATDKSVNKATELLYKTVNTPKKMLALGEEGLISYIKSIGLYRTKAKNVIAACAILVEKYGEDAGCVEWAQVEKLNTDGYPRFPANHEELEELPGVGRKTANVVLNVVYGMPSMPVDTHLLRISPRIGLSAGKNPLQVEKDLLRVIPQHYLDHAHHWLVLHGRYVCMARNPQCETCLINEVCKKNGI